MCMHLAWYKILGADKVFFLYWNMNKQISNEIRLRYQNCLLSWADFNQAKFLQIDHYKDEKKHIRLKFHVYPKQTHNIVEIQIIYKFFIHCMIFLTDHGVLA